MDKENFPSLSVGTPLNGAILPLSALQKVATSAPTTGFPAASRTRPVTLCDSWATAAIGISNPTRAAIIQRRNLIVGPPLGERLADSPGMGEVMVPPLPAGRKYSSCSPADFEELSVPHPEIRPYFDQSSTCKPGTRWKCRTLHVTIVAPCCNATAAIRRSNLPIFNFCRLRSS